VEISIFVRLLVREEIFDQICFQFKPSVGRSISHIIWRFEGEFSRKRGNETNTVLVTAVGVR
jgi:hypothetical protein